MKSVSKALLFVFAAAVIASTAQSGHAAAKPARVAAPQEADTPLMGEYAGSFTSAEGKSVDAVAKVVAQRRKGKAAAYRVTLTALAAGAIEKTVIGQDAKIVQKADLSGTPEDGRLALKGGDWTGSIVGEKLSASGKAGKFALSRHERKSPTLLAKPPAGAIVLMPYAAGKATSLAEWVNQKWQPLADGSALISGGSNKTKRQFRRFKLHMEFRIPNDLGGGNSGVYILDRYEIQILNSFGRTPGKGDCAAIYKTFAPPINACLPAGRWQTYDITFAGPKLEGTRAVKLPVVTVVHNGVTVHKDVKIPSPTGQAKPRGHAEAGPILLQAHGSATRFRNIWIVELD
jgi:hypothetical protein